MVSYKEFTRLFRTLLTLKLPGKLQPYGLYTYYVVHICDFGMLRVKTKPVLKRFTVYQKYTLALKSFVETNLNDTALDTCTVHM